MYRDLDDRAHNNWIARSIWRDPTSDAAKLVIFGKTNDSTGDIEIEFADDYSQHLWRHYVSERVTTKYQFLKRVERWVSIADYLVNQTVTLIRQRDSQEITEEAFLKAIFVLAREYAEQVEQKYDDGTTGPAEVRDAEMRFMATIGSGSNIFIPFTPRGLEIWTNRQSRNYMVKFYLDRYKKDREMLGFELKKLGG